ncbi:glycosyltransferase family 2 protein [Marivita sp. GX14005]|uniref:glycosyltransferase family 2 protein n=1 Tax=Marivita sp. GX14005 TaxID=2942276 RepID=UPI002018E1CA|nr:glycosyltransferase family 2 protein [Marivita sp. GX14005]MCL3881738.1 glycosyltransferase [Marivita sp. GX14005]
MLPGATDLPSVSVIVAAYNSALSLERAIDSALCQNGVCVDVIVSDDASSDDTAELAEKIAACDPRVSIMRSSVNRGPAGARNAALRIARGDWIAVLDADDSYEPGRLACMIEAAQRFSADLVLDDFVSVDDKGAPLNSPSLSAAQPVGLIDLQDWLRGNAFRYGEVSFGYAKPIIARRFVERIGLKYDERLRNGEDFHLVLGALTEGGRVAFTAQRGYRYTRRDGSVSGKAKAGDMRALLAADLEAIQRLDPAQAAVATPHFAARHRNLSRLMTTEKALGAVRNGKPVEALSALAKRPDAIARLIAHLAEALRKRIGTHA